MFLKKHLLEQLLQYFSSTAIRSSINCLWQVFQNTWSSKKSKPMNQSQKLETTARWKSGSCREFLLFLTADSAVCAAEILNLASLRPRKLCILVFCSLLPFASASCGVTLFLFCSDQSGNVSNHFMPIEGWVGQWVFCGSVGIVGCLESFLGPATSLYGKTPPPQFRDNLKH